MAILKYDINLDAVSASKYFTYMTNKIYRLLPNREEGLEWKKPLQSIIIELSGFERLLDDKVSLFSLLCKLEGLMTLNNEEDFSLYRKTIFESLSLLDWIKKNEFFR